jgi:hypothetical protein
LTHRLRRIANKAGFRLAEDYPTPVCGRGIMESRPSPGQLLHRIWNDEQSDSTFDEPSLAERVVLTLLVLVTTFSFRGFCAYRGKGRVVATEIYQILIVVVLGVLSFRAQLLPGIAFGVLAYLVYEVVGWSIFDIFVESKVADLHGRRSDLRAFMWGAYSYSIVAWAYGIYFWSTGLVVDSCGRPLQSVITGIYYSVITITTIGYGDYAPSRDAALLQLVVISEPLVGIIVLALYFAVLVSAVAETFRKSISR